METDTIRLGLLEQEGPTVDQHDPRVHGTYRKQPVFTWGPLLGLTEFLLLVFLVTKYVTLGCPLGGRVPMSAAEAARSIGQEGTLGGSARRRVADAVVRLRSLTVQSTTALPGGRRETLVWGFIESARLGDPRTSDVRLGDYFATAIRAGRTTWLDPHLLATFRARGRAALMLWVWLESEGGIDSEAKSMRRLVFLPRDASALPRPIPVSRLLGFGDSNRSRLLTSIRKACATVMEVDGRCRRSPETPQGRSVRLPR